MTTLPSGGGRGGAERDLSVGPGGGTHERGFDVPVRAGTDALALVEAIGRRIEKRLGNRGISVKIQNLHIHVSNDSSGAIMAESFEDHRVTDQSQVTGQAGPKAFGRNAKAEVKGDQVQHFLSRRDVGELEELLAELKTAVAQSKAPVDAKTAAHDQIDQLSEELATPDAQSGARSTWQTLYQWVTSALTVGLFATESAEKVKGLLERMSAIFR